MYGNRETEENQNSRSKNGNSNVINVEKGRDDVTNAESPVIFQYEYTSNGRNSWRGSRGGEQQQARGGARFQQQQRGGDRHSRGNGGYHSRGRGGQQRQDRNPTSS